MDFLDDEIRNICSELERPMLSKQKRIDLIKELAKLVAKRRLMIETLAKVNDCIPPSDDTSEED